MTQNTTTENQEEQETKEQAENDAGVEYTAAMVLGSTVIAISDVAVNAATNGAVHLPAQAEVTVVTIIVVSTFAMVLCYAARQITKLRIAARTHHPYEAPTVAEAPEGAPVNH
jgi:uncharacterized membrane-anchored protein